MAGLKAVDPMNPVSYLLASDHLLSIVWPDNLSRHVRGCSMNRREAVQQVLRTIEKRSYDTRQRYLKAFERWLMRLILTVVKSVART